MHEIKLDGYGMAERIDNGHAPLATRTGLDWTAKYSTVITAFSQLSLKTAYLDSELCGVNHAGLPSLEQIQAEATASAGFMSSIRPSIFCILAAGKSQIVRTRAQGAA